MATLGNTKYNSASASTFVADTSISAQNIVIKKSTSITHLDTTGISAANAFLTGSLTSATAKITSLSSSNFYFDKGFTSINPALALAVTASLGNVQTGVVSIQNQGLGDGMNFTICVESSKISSVSSVINTSIQTVHDFTSGVTLIPRITSIETGKFNFGLYVNDSLGSGFNDNFALHFIIVN
jgi:hypothetical protein